MYFSSTPLFYLMMNIEPGGSSVFLFLFELPFLELFIVLVFPERVQYRTTLVVL